VQSIPNCFDDSVHVVEHFVVPESDYSVAKAFEKFCPFCVHPLSLVVSVSVAINLDNQPGAEANEVADVLPQGMLTAELVAVHLPMTEANPQSLLGIVGISTKLPCLFCVHRVASHVLHGAREFGARERGLQNLL
jgi:hypothetical protein